MLAVTALAGASRLALAGFGARAARLVDGDGDDSLHDDCVNEDDRSCLDVSRLEMDGFPGQRSGTLIPLVDSNLLLFAIIPQRVIFSSFTFAPTPLSRSVKRIQRKPKRDRVVTGTGCPRLFVS
ncbi:hypothetical protein EV363DRAFT_1351759 [Boletus edulis]|nr:hypothetical protein EV363DRAFT_1351759 [Boletus edulis]